MKRRQESLFPFQQNKLLTKIDSTSTEAHDGIHQVIHEGTRKFGKCSADDNTDREIEHVSSVYKISKFLEH